MRNRLVPLCLPLSLVVLLPAVAAAQSAAPSNVEGRVGRLESEMRAVQRKVFPDGQLLQPDVVAPAASSVAPGSPASSAVIDLTQRVSSLEQQMATLTGQIEQNGYQLRTLREQFDSYKRSTDAKLAAMAAPPAISPATPSAPFGGGDGDDRSSAGRPPARGTTTAASVRPAPRDPVAAKPADAASLERPSTGDPAEDAYLYGYRLWQAKRYTEAQAQLKKTVADYPKSRRASYAQNLLGRAYLDDGKPSLASMAFYDNYKKMPDGERAPDSLLYLGQALVKLNKPADACKVYDELTDVYGTKLSATMQADVTRGRATAKCK